MSARSTKGNKSTASNALRPKYERADLGKGASGKYLADFQAGTPLVLLSPNVAEVFATPQAVNDALRSLIAVVEGTTRGVPRAPRARKPSKPSTTSPLK